MLCYAMCWTFKAYPRTNTKDNQGSLRSLIDWLPAGDFNEDAVLAERFTDTLFCEYNPAWGSTAAFRDTKDRPHLMFVMRDDIKPQGEDLLRGEALTIAAAIITRLEEFEEHKYIPILVLSFMGSLKGRIVRAYFDRKDIVIWKTKIYHFCPLEDAKK